MARPAAPRELGVLSRVRAMQVGALKKNKLGGVQHLPRMSRSTALQRALAGKPQSRVPFKFIKSIIPNASVPAPCAVTQNNPITLHYLYLGTGCHGLKNKYISPSFPLRQPQPWLGEKPPFRLASLALPSCSLSPVPPKVAVPEPPRIPVLRPSPPAAPSHRRRSPRPNHFKDLPSHKN